MKAVLSVGLILGMAFGSAALAATAADDEIVRDCLSNWSKHPFDAKKPKYRTIGTQVKVMGIGNDIIENEVTAEPELVLVKPNVAVMAKTLYSLMNPNGWYCMKNRVSVLGKTEIKMACKAHLTSNKESIAVLGGSDSDSGGTAVLGSTRIEKVGCVE